jgi:hypothetical protein
MSETASEVEIPRWVPTRVTIDTAEGEMEVPGIVHPWVKGLAVVSHQFGYFNVTHLRSGMKMSGLYERAGNACLTAASWAACVDCTGDAASIRAQLNDDPVPFPDATVTTGGQKRRQTKREWAQFSHTVPGDEFPWEGDENPWTAAEKVFELLRPKEGEAPT